MKTPTTALSIMQPWAWLIATGLKTIENRSWPTSRRGDILIHAGKKMDLQAHEALLRSIHPVTGDPAPALGEAYTKAVRAGEVHRGGIVGQTTIVDCVAASSDPWFVGDYGFVVRDSCVLPFREMKGALQFFRVEP